MKTLINLILVGSILLCAVPGLAQPGDDEELKLAAVEALITAPPDRALPLVEKVLTGNHSDRVKEAALFILSQIDRPGAREILLRFAREERGELQQEAIRMIGIGGGEAMASLVSIYDGGDSETREAVLEAFMIAGDKASVFELAKVAEGDDFEAAVEMLAVMGGREELRQLRGMRGTSEALIEACAISGDFQCLRELANDDSNIDLQIEAIESMGIVSSREAQAELVELYKNAANENIREAALDGLMISGNDEALLDLYRAAKNSAEKKELLEYLVMTGSDEVWSLIDSALGEDE